MGKQGKIENIFEMERYLGSARTDRLKRNSAGRSFEEIELLPFDKIEGTLPNELRAVE